MLKRVSNVEDFLLWILDHYNYATQLSSHSQATYTLWKQKKVLLKSYVKIYVIFKMKVFGELFTATIVTNFCQAVTLKAFLFNNRTENLVVKTIYTTEASS